MTPTLANYIGEWPILSLMIITLPIGAALIWLAPSAAQARWIALLTALVDLAFAVLVVAGFDSSVATYQFVETSSWIPTLNIHYKLGVDGISVLFLPLTVLLFIGVILASWNTARSLPRLYYTLLLLLESVTLGIFCALDTILFFLFWELTLIPLYFLTSLWGVGANRRYAAVKYTLLMLLAGVPLLFGFILLAFNHAEVTQTVLPAGLSFDYLTLLDTPMAKSLQVGVFFLLLFGFAVKTPVFPLHTWLPVISMEGPAAVAAIMTGLKLGVYGLIRFVIPLVPEAAREFHWLLAGLGVIGILYGALVAMHQTNLRRMLAFSSLSHVGLVVLGIASFSMQGIQGALFQLLNFAIVASGLFTLSGYLHQRIGSTDTVSLGGVARSMPVLAGLFFIFGLASMAVPGTNGFPAELLLLLSALQAHTGAGLAALLGIILTATYFLQMYRHIFLGPVRNRVVQDAVDLLPRELLIVVLFAGLILLLGFYPALVLDFTRAASQAWLQHSLP